MRVRIAALFTCLLCSFSVYAGTTPHLKNQLRAEQWAMFQGNPQHTGYYPGSFEPNKFHLLWKTQFAKLGLFEHTANFVFYETLKRVL